MRSRRRIARNAAGVATLAQVATGEPGARASALGRQLIDGLNGLLRERGLRSNLGQPSKSFRDRDVEFDVYRRGSPQADYLQTLGSLVKPE